MENHSVGVAIKVRRIQRLSNVTSEDLRQTPELIQQIRQEQSGLDALMKRLPEDQRRAVQHVMLVEMQELLVDYLLLASQRIVDPKRVAFFARGTPEGDAALSKIKDFTFQAALGHMAECY